MAAGWRGSQRGKEAAWAADMRPKWQQKVRIMRQTKLAEDRESRAGRRNEWTPGSRLRKIMMAGYPVGEGASEVGDVPSLYPLQLRWKPCLSFFS